MELYIIRHAHSTRTLAGKSDQDCDPALSDLGMQQSRILAQHLATAMIPTTIPSRQLTGEARFEGLKSRLQQGYGITRLYCSPMYRALQSTQPIGEALKLSPQIWLDLYECGGFLSDPKDKGDISDYTGKTRSEILSEFPNFVLPEGITEGGWWNRDDETEFTCQTRAIRVAERLRNWGDCDERIAIVTHAAFKDTLLKAICNQLSGISHFFHHNTAAISRVDFHKDGTLTLLYLNQVSHLPPELVI
jgi:broad specificity phosphatase PhoE